MVKRVLFLALFLGFTQYAWAGDFSGPSKSELKMRKKVVTLVQNAARLVRTKGRVEAACALNRQNRRIPKGQPYLFMFVCNDKKKNNSIVLVNKNVDFIFTSLYKHPNHIRFRKLLKKNPKGIWVNYKVKNPDTGRIGTKRSFLVMLPKYRVCIGSGYFTGG